MKSLRLVWYKFQTHNKITTSTTNRKQNVIHSLPSDVRVKRYRLFIFYYFCLFPLCPKERKKKKKKHTQRCFHALSHPSCGLRRKPDAIVQINIPFVWYCIVCVSSISSRLWRIRCHWIHDHCNLFLRWFVDLLDFIHKSQYTILHQNVYHQNVSLLLLMLLLLLLVMKMENLRFSSSSFYLFAIGIECLFIVRHLLV